MARPKFRYYAPIALVLAACISGCGPSSSGTKSHRVAQFGQNRDAIGVNALGERVSLADFTGKLVWVDYAAEWCAACKPQSAVVRSLASEYEGNVVFVTVMTSEPEGYGHPATQTTAVRWAQRASLDSSRVVAADLGNMTLPQHALFSPGGRELFRHTGTMSAAEIKATIRLNDVDR